MQDRPSLFRNRSLSRHFLFCQSDAQPASQTVPAESKTPFTGAGKGLRPDLFPNLVEPQSLVPRAMDRMGKALRFGVLVMRIDPLGIVPDVPAARLLDDVRLDVARSIQSVCSDGDALWGQMDADRFVLFAGGPDRRQCLQLADRIQTHLANLRSQTVTIGIALYPLLNYGRRHVLDNAVKALQHAEFFDSGSKVVFDAVSLNISGDQYYQQGDLDMAIGEFRTALLMDPSNVNVHNSLGVCYGMQGDLPAALEEFELVAWLDPKEAMAAYNIGVIHLLQGERPQALEYLLKAHRMAGDIFEIMFEIGRLHLEMEDFDQSRHLLEKAVRIRPRSATAHRYLGNCYRSLELNTMAVQSYQKAVRQNPNDAEALSALGEIFCRQDQNHDIARVFCQQSVAIAPENGLFRHRLGALYFKEQRLDEALEEFEQAIRRGHDSNEYVEKIRCLKARSPHRATG